VKILNPTILRFEMVKYFRICPSNLEGRGA
jgi:hypothetical protein